MGSIILTFMFIIVFCFTLFALQNSPFSSYKFPLALSVSGLAIIGLKKDFGEIEIQALLLPYEALALTFATILFLWLFARIKKTNSSKPQTKKKHESWSMPGWHRKYKSAENEISKK